MPEMIEVEAYRDLAERAALGRQISAIETPDEWYLKRGLVPATLQELIGYQLSAARRRVSAARKASRSSVKPRSARRAAEASRWARN